MSKVRTAVVEHSCGGKGNVILNHVLEEDFFKGKGRLYAQVVLKPGCSIGYHVHHQESETYFILSGKGLYDNNGCKKTVTAGDVTVTSDGMGHSLENVGDVDLVFMALILKD